MTDRRVLVSGAGIAGATVAYWLARSGWTVSVVEQSGFRSSGNPVDVRGEAVVVAQAMGIWPALRAAATGVTRLAILDAYGRRRATVATRRSVSADEEVEVARADLAAALLAAIGGEVEVHPDDTITALTQDPDGVDVEFARAAPRRFDLVLGADGLHSAVRRLVFGPESDFAHPFGMFVGTVQTEIDTGNPREVLMYNEPGRSLSIHPAGGRPVVAFIFRSRYHFDHRNPVAGRALVEEAYAGGGWVSGQALAEWRTAEEVYFDAVTRLVVPSWSRGRVGLLGDAASCVSLFGEGSSNAIVAGKTLADCLVSHPDHRAAFAAYEGIHRRRLRHSQRFARTVGRFLVPATGPGLALRNLGLRVSSIRWSNLGS